MNMLVDYMKIISLENFGQELKNNDEMVCVVTFIIWDVTSF